MCYDTIIAGASFAGLAVAGQIKGKILLIDRKDIGTIPTSACATLYGVVKKLGCEDSVLSILKKVKFHTASCCTEYKAMEPFCVFDYHGFCQGLAKHFEGEFLKANIKGLEGDTVLTDKGDFSAKCIVDCTGWRAALGTALKDDFVNKKSLYFGVETEVDCDADDFLSFFWDPEIVKLGYAWKFPVGKKTRFGLGGYENGKALKDNLTKFLSVYGKEINGVHGGFIPVKIRKPVIEKIFLVGDSAGHAWPLTGEGVRQAIYYGQKCGRIIQSIVEKEIDLVTGLKEYADFVNKHRCYHEFFSGLQWLFFRMPNCAVGMAAKLFGRGWPIRFMQRKYKKWAEL